MQRAMRLGRACVRAAAVAVPGSAVPSAAGAFAGVRATAPRIPTTLVPASAFRFSTAATPATPAAAAAGAAAAESAAATAEAAESAAPIRGPQAVAEACLMPIEAGGAALTAAQVSKLALIMEDAARAHAKVAALEQLVTPRERGLRAFDRVKTALILATVAGSTYLAMRLNGADKRAQAESARAEEAAAAAAARRAETKRLLALVRPILAKGKATGAADGAACASAERDVVAALESIHVEEVAEQARATASPAAQMAVRA